MRAVLSGSAAVALVNDGEDWHSIRYEDLETLLPQREEDFVRLFHESRDLDWLVDTSLDEVRIELEDAVDSTEALSLVFDLLDRRLSDETRDAAALELDELALEEVVIERVESVLLATPLPDLIDPVGATAACRRTNCQGTLALLGSWLDLQEAVAESWQAWLQIPVERFGTTEDRNRIQGQLIRHGVFREMAYRCLEPGGFNEVQFEFAGNVTLKRAVPGMIGILNDWTEPFRTISRKDAARIQNDDATENEAWKRQDSGKQNKQLPLKEKQRRIAELKSQITDAIRLQNIDQFQSLLDELVDFHSQTGNVEFCCMSLCDLASTAQQQNQYSTQKVLTERAVRVKPDDAWSWTQHGMALRNKSEFEEALKAYDQALDFGGDVVAQTGRAEVLKAQGKLELALEAYDLVRSQHPENVVALRGRASLLVLMRRWDDALADLDSAEDGRDIDWFNQHLRAVIYLRTNRRAEARLILSNGVENCPHTESRDYFRATLAQAFAAEGELVTARELAEQITYSRFDRSKNVLLTHILEQEKKLDLAREVYERLPEPANDDDVEVFSELQRRVTGLEPAKSNEWLQEHIFRLVLTA